MATKPLPTLGSIVAKLVILLACLAAACSPVAGVHDASIASNGPRGRADVGFQEFTLKNGLRVILSEDHTSPTYSISVTYNVGSRDEPPGRTGFAHLFEHMMFQGSENVGKGEHFILILNNGGSANGTTNAERTNYFATLPANQLELGIFLEADRMRALDVTQANLNNQRHAVQEERRLNYDNRPYGLTGEVIFDTAYDRFPYKHSTIGSMDDLNAASLEEVQAFYRTYYAPNNAVLALVGDFETEAALALVKKYFENVPPQPRPPAPETIEPQQHAERRKTIVDGFAQAPRIDIVFKTVPGNTPDWYALRVLGHILAGDLSSRLYRTLVKDLELAVSVSSGPDERRGPSLFWISLVVRPEKPLPEVERLVYEQLDRLAQEPVADWELDKVRIKLRREQAESLYSTRARANAFSHFAVYYNEPNLINTIVDKIAQVNKTDIQGVAGAYLKASNRTVVITVPKKGSSPRVKTGS